ncbi:MAG TPA: hypothetical protein PKD37_06920 [Oligoflexia bacterium]|nr:hypothetical protein [Oligoflexia bacterium]HMP27695.1 hypothetical protein [Oligoflexia bacterium]
MFQHNDKISISQKRAMIAGFGGDSGIIIQIFILAIALSALTIILGWVKSCRAERDERLYNAPSKNSAPHQGVDQGYQVEFNK